MRGDGKHNRDYRDNRGSYAPRDYRGGRSWESSRGSFSTMPKQPNNGDILRLVYLCASSFTVLMRKGRKFLCSVFLLGIIYYFLNK